MPGNEEFLSGRVQTGWPENSLNNKEGPMFFITEKTILFQGSRGGPSFSRGGGGSNFFQGGSKG